MSGCGRLLFAFGWLKSFVLCVTKANRLPGVAFAATPSADEFHGLNGLPRIS
jgi:hypothetical protein